MKNIISKTGEVLVIVLFIPIMLFILVAVLPLILLFMLLDMTRKLSKRLRKDPRHTPSRRYQIYKNSEYPRGQDALMEYFNKYITVVKKYCGIKLDPRVIVDGHKEVEDEQSDVEVESVITISTKLETDKGVATLKMEALGGSSGDDLFVSIHDGDVPPFLEVVYAQTDGLRTVFYVSGSEEIEFLIASLKSGQHISNAGQAWARIKDGLWIVNYSIKKTDKSDRIGVNYGYRHEFSETKAHQYFFD